MTSKISIINLNNDNKMPILATLIGTSTYFPEKTAKILETALDQGYRHFSCTGESEIDVGKGINAQIQQGAVQRKDLFISSSLRCSFYHPDLVLPALTKTLENLQTTYLDLFVLELPKRHIDPYGIVPNPKFKVIHFIDVIRTWKAMEDAVDAGLVKSIGIAHFNGWQVKQLLSAARIKPVTNKIQCDAYVSQKAFSNYMKSVNIALIAVDYCGSPCEHPKGAEIRLLDHPMVNSISQRFNRVASDILARYQLQCGHAIECWLVDNKRPSLKNFENFTLNSEDMDVLSSLDVGCSETLYPMQNQ